MVGFQSPILVLVFCLSHLCFVSILIFLPPLDMLNFFNHSILSPVFKYTSLWYILVAIVEQWFLNFSPDQDHLEGLLNPDCWAPSLKLLIQWVLGGT